MRKTIAVITAVALVTFSSGISLAAFTSDGKTTPPLTATVTTTTGAPRIVPFTSALKNISNDAAATQIAWTNARARDDNWKAADQYLEVTGYETHTTWGIQIYTDNKSAVANPRYTADSGDPAGLVRATGTAQEIGKSALPMCWRVIADKKFAAGSDDLNITQKYIAATDTYALLRIPGDYTSDTRYFAPWFWMLDKGTPDVDVTAPGEQPFGDYQEYATCVGGKGIQLAPQTWLPIPQEDTKYRVYFGAKFINAVAAATYTTNQVWVEMYHL